MNILQIKNEDGTWSAIPAIKGTDGKTPQKGIDYWTEEDKTGIVNDVITALPKWQSGGNY